MSSTLMAQRATALQNYMTQLATAVQNQLSNPDGSTVCAHCVNVLRVLHAKDEKLALELRSSQRGLYDGLIRCITSVQHARDIDDFRQRVEETSRICNRTHQRQIPSQGLFQHSVRSMFGIIEDAFVGKSSPSAIANGSSQYPTNARKFFRSSVWPTSQTDILTAEPAMATRGYIEWSCAMISNNALIILNDVVHFCRPLVFPHILLSPNREKLLWTLL
ncbi:hypothetical protein BKA62DRAFT_424959 [Auriculariales sp. MPI-PUGE-AT-0066]|nr:hypothetical protein BKA62DRAFT_424959 [Auriculariales sp. MPI-PUGE-AT-0066]